MSLIRPELAERLRQDRESLLAALVALLGAWLVWRGYAGVDGIAFAAGLLLAVTGLSLLRAARRRAGLRTARAAAGLVEVDEGRIAYFGPLGGAFLDRDALTRVEFAMRAGNPLWRVAADDGSLVEIPLGASGAEGLIDAFASLPGFDEEAAATAFAAGRPGTVTLWERGASQTFRRLP